MNKLIMSTEKLEFCEQLQQMGFDIIPSENIREFLSFERRHADMQCLRIEDTIFVLKECSELISSLEKYGFNVIATKNKVKKDYPGNVILNAVYLNRKLFCKVSAIDRAVTEYCKLNDIQMINVNQGYTKCSTALINNRFITADKGIFKAMKESGEEGELIEAGGIDLAEVNYGFIGGCCFEDEKNVFFTGNIKRNPDYKKIKAVCVDKNIICLSDKTLYDIGGFVLI